MNKNYIKVSIQNLLPGPVSNGALWIWRKFYWWKKNRISHRQNLGTITRFLKSGKPVMLELASWKRTGMEEWIASDINGNGDIQLDLLEPLPFPNSSVDKIYSSHLMEHFSYPSPMLEILSECYRVMKPGGEFSIAVPNARLFIEGYIGESTFDPKEFCGYEVGLNFKSKIDFINYIAYLGGEHKHLFDAQNLVQILEDAGFAMVELREFDASIDLKQRHKESIYARAFR